MADNGEQLGLATEVTVAWLSNPHTRAQADDVETMLSSVLTALRDLEGQASASPAAPNITREYTPAVTVRKSLASPDRIVSMIDGKPYGSLKRHLRANGLTPDEYRHRYGLREDYPMVAPGLSAARSAAAKRHGFGRKSDAKGISKSAAATTPEPQKEGDTEAATPTKRRRLGISGARRAAQAHLGTSDGKAQLKSNG